MEKSQSAISPSSAANTNTNTSSSSTQGQGALALALLLVGVQFCFTQYVSRFYMDAIVVKPDEAAR